MTVERVETSVRSLGPIKIVVETLESAIRNHQTRTSQLEQALGYLEAKNLEMPTEEVGDLLLTVTRNKSIIVGNPHLRIWAVVGKLRFSLPEIKIKSK